MAHNLIPKGTIPLVGAIVGFSLVVVTVATLMEDTPPAPLVAEDPVVVTEITFADGPDGGILVRNDAGEMVLPPEYNQFVRGVIRALARERRKVDAGPEAPFVLSRGADGALIIGDPETGERIDLRAFGRDNALAFVPLLPGASSAAAATVSVE